MKRIFDHAIILFFLALLNPAVVSASGEKMLVFLDSIPYSGHQAAIDTSLAMIRGFGRDSGFSVDTTTHLSSFSSANLANYDAVLMLYPYRQTTPTSSTWLNDTMNASEDSAFKNFMLSGKGYVGVHCASRLNNNWPWFLHDFSGVRYLSDSGPVTSTYHVADTSQSMTRGIPRTFNDQQQVRGDSLFFSDTSSAYTVLIKADSSNYLPGKRQPFYPFVFMHDYQGARIWIGSMGHNPTTWSTPAPSNDTIWRKLILRGILYALNRPGYGRTTTVASPGRQGLVQHALVNGKSFEFILPYESRVQIRIYDAKGVLIKTLLDDFREKGAYSIPIPGEIPEGYHLLDLKAEGIHEVFGL